MGKKTCRGDWSSEVCTLTAEGRPQLPPSSSSTTSRYASGCTVQSAMTLPATISKWRASARCSIAGSLRHICRFSSHPRLGQESPTITRPANNGEREFYLATDYGQWIGYSRGREEKEVFYSMVFARARNRDSFSFSWVWSVINNHITYAEICSDKNNGLIKYN